MRTVRPLEVRVFKTRAALGTAAAVDIATAMRAALDRGSRIRMVFAAAPSQSETLAELVLTPDLDWTRVTGFHMDEYIGLPSDAPARFGRWLDLHLFSRVPFAAVHRLGTINNREEDAERYSGLLAEAPIDIVCLGIGVNGHLAFNDPPVADFGDPLAVKVVELDSVCRQQQVDDGCFPSLAAVPTHAITLTIPRLLAASELFCVVPGSAKRDAVTAALKGTIAEACPASALRTHPACRLYLDRDSASAGIAPEPRWT